jgi:tol-pal system protein YbgF
VSVRRARALAVALSLAACALPARAGLFDDDEARKRIADTNARLAVVQKQLEDRIAGLEQQVRSQGLLELVAAVDALKADLARVRGQIEVLTHELAEAQRRQRDLYVDLDTRMRKLESAQAAAAAAAAAPPPAATPPVAGATVPVPAAGVVPAVAAPAAGGDVAAEQRAYDAALGEFKRADYAAAIASFGAFVKAYPKSPLAPSAQYWIGNAQFARKDFRGAIGAQRQLIAAWPDSAKVPDALLNIASAQAELNETAAARRTLEELIAKYPSTEAGVKAKQRLGVR